MNAIEYQHPIFPRGEKAPAEYFAGTVWINVLVPNDAMLNCQVANVDFEAGGRTNWHTHPGGQVLIVTDGVGYYQEKGKPIKVLRKADVVNIAPGIEHWHGASSDSDLTHIAINPNARNGVVNWLERVTEEEYHSL
jgi:quercetin dioxygenase-like cupin family protein